MSKKEEIERSNADVGASLSTIRAAAETISELITNGEPELAKKQVDIILESVGIISRRIEVILPTKKVQRQKVRVAEIRNLVNITSSDDNLQETVGTIKRNISRLIADSSSMSTADNNTSM